MVPALYIPTVVRPPCRSLPHTFASATAKQCHKRYHLALGFVYQYFSLFRFPSPSPSLSPLPSPFTAHSPSHSASQPVCLCFPSPFLTALHVLLTIAIVIVIAIPRKAPSTGRRSRIHPVLMFIILLDPLYPIQWFNGQAISWHGLPAARWLIYFLAIIATIPRAQLTGACNHPWAGCLWTGAIDSIPEGKGVIPLRIVHLLTGFVKHLPHIWVEDCTPVRKRWTSASAVRPHWPKLSIVASRDWIKKDYITKEVSCTLIHETVNIVYPYGSMDVFRQELRYMVPIKWQAAMYNRCRHLCPSSWLPLSFAAALWCPHCVSKMNLHPRH